MAESLHYGEVMVRARRRAKLTQEDVARLAGISQRTVSAWELGAREPNVTAFLRYMRACRAGVAMLARVDPEASGAMRWFNPMTADQPLAA